MTYRLCVSNQKGGTGKTTVAINLSGALAARDADVLLVDLDPQGYATEGAGLPDAYDEASPTMHDVLLDTEDQDRINDIVRTGEEFDVVPSNVAMSENNTETQLRQATAGEQRLTRALDALERDYDVIVIDCPPGLGALTDNALLATRSVVIPAEAKGTSMRALELLTDQMESLETFFGGSIDPVAVVVNEVRQDGVSDQMTSWFDDVFGDSDVPVFEVRKRVVMQRAMMAGRSLATYDEECDMEAVFDDLAAHIEQEASLR